MSLINKAQKTEKSDAAGNTIFNTPYTVDSKVSYASGEGWITVVVSIANNS